MADAELGWPASASWIDYHHIHRPAPWRPPLETTFGTWFGPTEYLPMPAPAPPVAAVELLVINRNIDPNRPPSGVDAPCSVE